MGISSIAVAFTLIVCALIMFLNTCNRNSQTDDSETVLKIEHYVLAQDFLINDSIVGKIPVVKLVQNQDSTERMYYLLVNDTVVDHSIVRNMPVTKIIQSFDSIQKANYVFANHTMVKDSNESIIDYSKLIQSLNSLQIEHLDLSRKYETLINDVRQETNNNLDKLNTWLSFWIGILAVFGVLAPIVAEYRFRLDNEKRWEEKNNEIDETFKKYRTLMAATELESCVNSLVLCHDYKILSIMSGRTEISIGLLRQVQLCLRQFINENINENESIFNYTVYKDMLIRILIVLLSLTQSLKYWDTLQNQIKKIEMMHDDIRQILKNLSEEENVKSPTMKEKILRIADRIDNLCNGLT